MPCMRCQNANLTKISLALSICSINESYKNVWWKCQISNLTEISLALSLLTAEQAANLDCTWSFSFSSWSEFECEIPRQIQAGCLNQPTIIISCGRALLQILFTWEISSCGNVGSTSGHLEINVIWAIIRKTETGNRQQKVQIVKTWVNILGGKWKSAKCKSLQSLEPGQEFGFTHPDSPAIRELTNKQIKYWHTDFL